MSTDITELVHESIGRFTDGARLPADLAQRAAEHNHRRRIAVRAGATTGAAVIAAIAVALAETGVPRPVPAGQATLTTAYVVNRTERAVATAIRKGDLERIDAVGIGATETPALGYSHGHGKRSMLDVGPIPDFPTLTSEKFTAWWHRGRYREEGFTLGGRPLYDDGVPAATAPAGARSTGQHALVDYPARTWYSNLSLNVPGAGTAPPSCGNPPDPQTTVGGGPSGWTVMLRVALRCGQLKVAGRQWIHGIHAIKIISQQRLVKSLQTIGGLKGTLWVDPATYLPLRVRWTWREAGKLSGDFHWLPPTRANLAVLNIPIPAGFRAVRVPTGTLLTGEAMMERLPLKS